jgi:hypothetical protein
VPLVQLVFREQPELLDHKEQLALALLVYKVLPVLQVLQALKVQPELKVQQVV